jgi:hypothetical protein
MGLDPVLDSARVTFKLNKNSSTSQNRSVANSDSIGSVDPESRSGSRQDKISPKIRKNAEISGSSLRMQASLRV